MNDPNMSPAPAAETPLTFARKMVERLWNEIPLHRRAQMMSEGWSIDQLIVLEREASPVPAEPAAETPISQQLVQVEWVLKRAEEIVAFESGKVAAYAFTQAWGELPKELQASPVPAERPSEPSTYAKVRDTGPTLDRISPTDVADALGSTASPIQVAERARLTALEAVAQSLVDFQRLYQEMTWDTMPGNAYYAVLLLNICEAAQEALLSPSEAPKDDRRQT